MAKHRTFAALAIAGAAFFTLTGTAAADHDGYTDGTETYPVQCDPIVTDFCTRPDGTGLGPIPYGPVFIEECAVVELDPPFVVMVTLHFDYDGDGLADAHDVFPYVSPDPGNMTREVTAFVEGRQGEVWGTWNIGSGETAKAPFDCVPETTTTVPETTTTTTVKTLATDHELPNVTAPEQFVEIDEPAVVAVEPATVTALAELPHTGPSDWHYLLGLGIVLTSLGLWGVRAGRRADT